MINIQNFNDNECSKCCLVKNVYPSDYNSRWITKADKLFGDELGFEDIKIRVIIKDIHKIEKKSTGISAFGYENKVKYRIHVSEKAVNKKILIHLCQKKKTKDTTVWLKILIHLCMIRKHTVEETIFAVII